MKNRFLFLLLLLGIFFLPAQGQNQECVQMAAKIDSLVKLGDFDRAYDQWELSQKCAVESIFTNGEKMLLYKLAAPSTPEKRQEYIASLLNLYDTYDKKIAGNKNGNLVRKAMAMQTYNAGTSDEIYALLDKAFRTDRANFNDAKALYTYFELFYGKFKSGDKAISEENVFATRDEMTIRLGQLSQSHPESLREYKTAVGGINALVSAITSCDKLNSHYGAAFESRKKDTLWLQAAAENLMLRNCSTGVLFLNIAAAWYQLKPGAESAYNMAIASMRNRKPQSETLKYFDLAADLQTDPGRKAETYLSAASMLGGSDVTKAIGYTRKAIAARPNSGKPYLLLAQLYVSANCGELPFEKKAVHFLAAQTAKKAGAVEVSMVRTADAAAALYLKKAPSKAEIKAAKKAGKTVTFGCGINESVVIPQ